MFKTLECQRKLCELLPNNPNLINLLAKHGVIAGGAVVYALNDYVPIESVGDIDVFVNNKKTLIKLVESVMSLATIEKIELMYNYFDDSNIQDRLDEKSKGSVCTIKIADASSMRSIQFILKQFKNVEDVITDFDLDYVQCAYHLGQFHRTHFAMESHQEQSVIYAMQKNISQCRLMKAVQKGFSCPVFGCPRNHLQTITLSYPPDEEQLVFIDSRTNLTVPYKIREKILPTVHISGKDFKSDDGSNKHLERCSLKKVFFDYGNGYYMKSFSVCVRIEELNPYDQPHSCKIYPIQIGNIEVCKLKYKLFSSTFQPVLDQTYNVLVSLYSYFVPELEHRDDYKFQVSMFLESEHKDLMEPTNFDDNTYFPIDKLKPNVYCFSKSRQHLNTKDDIVKHIEGLIKNKEESKWRSDLHKANAYRAFLYHFVQENKSEEESSQIAAGQMSWDSIKRNQRSPADYFMMMIPQKTVSNHYELIKHIEKFSAY